MKFIVAGTGHRPKDIPEGWDWIRQETNSYLTRTLPTEVISGMAQGFDIVLAEIALELGLSVTCAIPYYEHYEQGLKDARYKAVVEAADEVHFVCEPGYAVWKLHKRNEWMVDHATTMIACWNGKESGGTWNCINYALKKNKGIIRLNPVDKTVNAIG